MVMDLTGEVGVIFVGRFENHLGTICELVRGEIDFSKRAFADKTAKSVVADRLKILVRELVQQLLVRISELRVDVSSV